MRYLGRKLHADDLATQGDLGGGGSSPPIVTAFPSSPSHGDEVYYRPQAGVMWHCVYDASAGTYGWVVLGGAALSSEVMTEQSTASTSYTTLATAGPTISLPRAGIWDIEIMAYIRSESNARGNMSYQVGATAASDDDAATMGAAAATHTTGSVSSRRRKTVATAATLSSRYKSTSGSVTVHFSRRRMFARPVRFAS